ncbi:golgin subfamily A member 5-like [Paralichthys olivaceus]|uniref:golgin subfamily A member 5-like n=1 Tax=Paralichthys olivaceus TaxID=8255 RepID=UPI003751EB07
MQQLDTVTSLRAELLQAFSQIKALTDGSTSLNKEVEELKDKLKEKDGLLKKETKKRRARTEAYILCLSELTECQAKCKSLEAALHQEPSQPETSWSREVDEETKALKEEVQLLKVGQRKLEDDLTHKNGLIMSEKKKRIAYANAYIDCLAVLTTTEKELKKSQAETLQVKLQQEKTSTVGLKEVEDIKRQNMSLKEQVLKLQSERTKLEEEGKKKDKLMREEANLASTKLHLAFFNKMSEAENELETIERMWRREEQQLETNFLS